MGELLIRSLATHLRLAIDPVKYARSMDFEPYGWQIPILERPSRRKLINGARQAGKSTLISVKPCHMARFTPGSLSVILAAREKQAKEDMRKVRRFVGSDKDFPELVGDAAGEITLANGSRIAVVVATEAGARGYTHPQLIILDETSRIEEEVIISAVLPMLVSNRGCELIAISTPHGKRGFFWRMYHSARWDRYEVRSPWQPTDTGVLVAAIPEEQYRRQKATEGIRAWYSPRHADYEEQVDMLDDMGTGRAYRQECCVEFVEPAENVFREDEITAMLARSETAGIMPAPLATADVHALSL